MYVWSTYFALHKTRFETKYSILGDPAIPVHYLIGETLQRSDGLVGYVECPSRQVYYDWHQSQSHLDQSILLLVTIVYTTNCHSQNEGFLQTVLRHCLQPTNKQFPIESLPPSLTDLTRKYRNQYSGTCQERFPRMAASLEVVIIIIIRPSY